MMVIPWIWAIKEKVEYRAIFKIELMKLIIGWTK